MSTKAKNPITCRHCGEVCDSYMLAMGHYMWGHPEIEAVDFADMWEET